MPRFLVACLLLLLAAACAPRYGAGEQRPTPGESYAPAAAELLVAVNRERLQGARCGDDWYGPAPTLALEGRLTRAAELHSADMRQHHTMSHAGSDGSSVGQRVTRQGYRWQVVAENVAWGYRTVEAVMAGWMGSPGHCRAIMGDAFEQLGAAEDGTYWTLVFADPH